MVLVKCGNCEKTFSKLPHEVKPCMFCSRECSRQWRSKTVRSGWPTCLQCPRTVNKKGAKFCSQSMNRIRYVGHCLFCKWESPLRTGPVFAGWHILRHVKEEHRKQWDGEADGLVGYVEKREVSQ